MVVGSSSKRSMETLHSLKNKTVEKANADFGVDGVSSHGMMPQKSSPVVECVNGG